MLPPQGWWAILQGSWWQRKDQMCPFFSCSPWSSWCCCRWCLHVTWAQWIDAPLLILPWALDMNKLLRSHPWNDPSCTARLLGRRPFFHSDYRSKNNWRCVLTPLILELCVYVFVNLFSCFTPWLILGAQTREQVWVQWVREFLKNVKIEMPWHLHFASRIHFICLIIPGSGEGMHVKTESNNIPQGLMAS